MRLNQKWLISLFCIVSFFALYLFIFQPGYLLDDDISIISLASGYLGGKSVPFLVFSNVILGFLLNLLYRLPTNINWEFWLFVAVNVVSVWCLVYLILSLPLTVKWKAMVVLIVLRVDGFLLLSITYTMIAAFAAIAGFCSMLYAAYLKFAAQRWLYLLGGTLIFVSSLIRIETVPLVLLSIILPLVFMRRLFRLKSLIISSAILGFTVFGGYLFNRIYVQSSSEWDSFYAYNYARTLIHDTPRIHQASILSAGKQIGWNEIDYEMFSNWFISDEKTFSQTNLQYLINHVPGTESDLGSTLLSHFYFYLNPGSTAAVSYGYVFLIVISLLIVSIHPLLRHITAPLLLLLFSVWVLATLLIWTRKLPPQVWYSFLDTVFVFGFFTVVWSKLSSGPFSLPQRIGNFLKRFEALAVPSFLVVTLLLTIAQAASVSRTNEEEQSVYRKITSSLSELQTQGKLQQNALIVIPANGIPLEWSDPMILDFPSIQVLEMGWLAFSPPYDAALQQYDAYPLLTALYSKDNVYFMTRQSLISDVLQFIGNHTGVVVRADPVYAVDYPGLGTGIYTNMVLYKISRVK